MLRTLKITEYAKVGRTHLKKIIPILLLLISLFCITSTAICAEDNSFSILQAGARGIEKLDSAGGYLLPTYDSSTKMDVYEVSYTLPQGSRLEVWSKDLPEGISPDTVNTAKMGLQFFDDAQTDGLVVTVRLIGTQGTQEFPARIASGWTYTKEKIEWDTLGEITEVVFVISSDADGELSGSLYCRLDLISAAAASPAQAITNVIKASVKALSPKEEAQSEKASAPIPSSFNLLDATKRGVTPSGDASGAVLPTYNDVLSKDVLEVDYDLPRGSSINVWIQDLPEGLGAETVNALRLGISIPKAEHAFQMGITVALKGTEGTQNIELPLKAGWNSLQKAIDWQRIGTLDALSFVISHTGSDEKIKGYLDIAGVFVQSAAVEAGLDVEPFPAKFTHMDAGAKGMFNIGASNGIVGVAFDENAGKDVLTFDYTAEVGSYVGVWTQAYPEDLQPTQVDALKIGVHVPNKDQVKDLAVKVEVKGSNSIQVVPLTLDEGWNFTRAQINWNMIGDLKEVVFVTSPKAQLGGSGEVRGTVSFDVDFYKLTFMEKYFTYIKILLVFLFALLLALAAAIFLAKNPQQPLRQLPNDTDASFGEKITRDFFYAVMIVLTGAAALYIHYLGRGAFLDAGITYAFLGVAAFGVILAELWKVKFTGQHLTPFEVFQNVLFVGLLAASSGRQDLLAVPSSWSQIFIVSNVTATIAFLIYALCNARALCKFGKHMRFITGLLIVATPYLFGWLLIVQNTNLLSALSGTLTLGLLSAWPLLLHVLGRTLVVFGFNEAVANGIGLFTKGRVLKQKNAHTVILLVSAGVVVAPLIANLGSGAWVAGLPVIFQAVVAILATMLAYAGLWGEVYLITGMLLDSGKRTAPSKKTIAEHVKTGTKKGMAYSGILVAFMYIIHMVVSSASVQAIMSAAPLVIGVLVGTLVFPLIKNIIETFDGSLPFFQRARFNYKNWVLYARGAVVGFGFSSMLTQGMFQQTMSDRIVFGLTIGLIASVGISILRDAIYMSRGQGKIQSWKMYITDGLLGAFVGSAAAFYLDARQVPVIIEKFKLYTSSGFSPVEYITYPLVNKWGMIDLGSYTGGARLLYTESLAGVINWSIAAWLFAINKVFMQAFFEKDTHPIKFFFSRAGFAQLIEHMIYVLRWGLWMSPIIFTFLRMMPSATWYNQDGAIRTILCIFNNATMSPEGFQAWSLKVFVYMLAFDSLRVLIWMDHMGLRVATLVNLSFLGLDRLDEKVARFIGPGAAQRYIPEAVKRFCTWAPLLIPFYLPRGDEWDYAWNTSIAMQNAKGPGLLVSIQSLETSDKILLSASAILGVTALSFFLRNLMNKSRKKKVKVHTLANREYTVFIKESGEVYSEIDHQKRGVYPPEYDLTRRSYDPMHPCGRTLFLVDTAAGGKGRSASWPLVGNFPTDRFEETEVQDLHTMLRLKNSSNGIATTVDITLPETDTKAEIWTVTIENLTDEERALKLVPYCEWVLNGGLHDRFHTQYARLFPEMSYHQDINAVLAWQKGTSSMGILASDQPTEGFLSSRLDFIGRARSLWTPRSFETFDFLPPKDTDPYPTFDPIGSFVLNAHLSPKGKKTMRLLIGYETDRQKAIELVKTLLHPAAGNGSSPLKAKKRDFLIGHGEIVPGTPQPYSEYTDNGNTIVVHTPFTTRPYDHAMTNHLAHSVMVTNRGLHTTCNGNSQQNRLTPDWPDTVTKEVPSETIYIYDTESGEWFAPTYEPLKDMQAKNTCEFNVDGTATFHMSKGTLATELTVFVPQDEPAGIYLLKIKNTGKNARTIRVSPYFQMVLAFQSEQSGHLMVKRDEEEGALYFYNPRNIFRKGWAFASMTMQTDALETDRGKYFGKGRGFDRPFFVEKGKGDENFLKDPGQIAAFLGTVKIPAGGEHTVAVVMGQTDERTDAMRIVSKFKNLTQVKQSLAATKKWWLNLMETAKIETNQPEFDTLQNWLKYQALAERIWARRGFYQTSGAYGFRDQLQDTVNLMWIDPALARKQIILHASHQFVRGDVYHWFFTLTDGRTAFACRSQASDNPLWLSWSVREYVNTTGDHSLLDEMTTYVASEFPYGDLPKNKEGWGHIYHRSTQADTVYRHCMKSIDLVIGQRLGRNGLPLIMTGDWNDGLDEIGSEGIGESVWLGFFLYYILQGLIDIIEQKDGPERRAYYESKMEELKASIEATWRGDRYLRAFHDDGTEIGVKDSGIWEIDALTVAWAVMCGINHDREVTVFQTALNVLERENAILLGWPALREDSKPYLGRSSKYPEGVRENGMYCHGVQWMLRAARILAERFEKQGEKAKAAEYREIGYRLWRKITPVAHVTAQEIEVYGGQPNKQPADILTNYDVGRMIWNGYTGAAGWLLRQSFESIIGATLDNNRLVLPDDLDKPRGKMKIRTVKRDISNSPLRSMKQYYPES